ncbi:NAD(P)/FAD-dependent oxidoreductase [Streptosporangium amethystogenes subsp. fukuiense]|uniref:NAD(P)/FAD-dependent oxidoreductase n=3 Tax=Streptosporangium amethystogenes TaxID=2002 RepID=A0ABW2T1N0_9ACTN
MSTRTADAVIVGAGVLGASVASHLARSGHRVLVLERGAPGREGSGTTAGNLHMQAVHTKRPGQAVPLDSARFLPLQRAASDRWETLEEELETSVEVRRTGGFTIAETEEQYQELRDKHGWEAAAGIHTEILDGDAARAALPLLGPTVAAATWCDLDGYANPLKVTPAYLDSAARHGGRTVAFAPVRRITRNGDGWRVVAGRGAAERVVDTPVVVDVAGPWLGEIAALAGITLRMTPVAIQMHATVRSSATMSHLVQHIGEGLSVKQVAAGNLLIGGGWPALSMDLAGRSDTSLDSLVGNVALAVRVLPFIRDLRLLRMWAGPLAATPDEMPVIGEVPGAPGFYVAGGTYAFTFAPLWGETLRCLIEGKPPPVDVSDLGPGRLMERWGQQDNGPEQENHQDRRSKRC